MKTKFSKVRSLLGRSELILIFAAALLMGLPLFAAATSPQIQSELQAVARELQLSDQPYGGSEETDLANEGSDGAQGEEVSADSDTSTTINDQPAQETQDSAGDPAADSGDTGADETNTVSSDDTVEAGGYIGIEPFAVGATDFVGNFTDLQSAMTTGSTTRVIAIMNNITLTSPITVPAGRDITLVTNGTTNLQTGVHPTNARFTLFAPPGQAISSPTPANTTVAARSDINANRHIYISGNSTLNLVNIVIDGGNIPAASATPYGGGIQATANATVNMRGRSIIQNNQQIFGGGLLMASGTFSMTHNAEIVNNRVVSNFNSGTPGFALTPGTPPAGQQMPRWITLDSPAGTAGRNTVLGGGILLMSSAASMADTAQIRSNETRLTFVNTHSTFAYPTDPGPGSGQNPAALPGAPVAFTLADSGNGGGVYMDGGTFDMTGNAGIASNGAHGTFSTDVNGMAANFTRNSAGGGVFIRGGGLFSTSDPGPNHVHINANITRSTST
ncbi:MAG: hypothetical protein FWD93_05355, partial [Coriobacteriia bacterium]|nr:hypothetical protein [Coriobacteriia bacterium]